MNKQIITFSANEQTLLKTGGIDEYAGEIVAYIEAHFDLGENWSGYDSVRAVWYNPINSSCIATVLDSQGHCVVPHEVLVYVGKVQVNLVGSISENNVLTDRLTTHPITAVTIKTKPRICGTETAPITPSQFEQYVAIVQALVGTVRDIDRIELNDDYTLTIYYSDGTSDTTSSIRGATGNGIASIAKTGSSGSNPVVDTYTVTYTDGNTFTFTVTNGIKGDTGATGATGATGNGIQSVYKTGTSGLVDTYTILFTNGNTTTFEVTNGQNGSLASTVLAPTYSSSAKYAVGDYVYYSGNLYRCTTAITTAEAWTAGHWTQVALAPEVSDLKSDIDKIAVSQVLDYFEEGTFNAQTGGDTYNGARIRTKGYISENVMYAVANTGYEFLVYAYSNGSYVGCWQTSNVFAKSTNVQYVKSFTFRDNYDYKVVLRNESDTAMDKDTDYVNIAFYTSTDSTLTKDGKSADSKIVGDKLNGLNTKLINHLVASSLGESDVECDFIDGISTFSSGAINGSGSNVPTSTSYRTDYYIELPKNALVKATLELYAEPQSNPYCYICFYDENKAFLSRIGGRVYDLSIIVDNSIPTSAKYCRITLTYVEVGNVKSFRFSEYYQVPNNSPKNKWYVLGDSISAGYYSMTESMAEDAGVTLNYNSPVTTEDGEATGSVWDSTLAHNYWGYANKWFLNRQLIGKAYPGQGYFRTASNSQNGIYVVDHNDFSDAGLITVAWGFNDWHYNQPRGTHNLIDSSIPVPTDDFDTSRITTVNQAIWYCLGRLIKKAPKAKIVVQTPMNGWAYGGDFSTNWGIGYSMSQSDTLKDIHDDIIYWCDYYGLQYIDMTFNNSIVNRVNIKDTIIDGSHPSDEAHKQLARSVWTKIGY